ncbi:LysR substrate-binding domain-containing protein, partial [Acinetobacter baumannii]|uniref:LysR substrate-binding domain-containing protein n=1 Tax=Acinetobacter baumannii TaxID=470 RepID=UPI001D187CE6
AMHAGLLARALRSFRRAAPGAELALKGLRSSEQVRQLQARDIDIGFTYSPPAGYAGLRSRLVWEEPFRLAFPAERGWMEAPSNDRMRQETFIT